MERGLAVCRHGRRRARRDAACRARAGAPAASLAPTTGAPGPSVRIALLAPQPATGALVVPVITPLPSVPGVSLLHLEVLVPPAPSLRRDVSLETAQVLTSMLAAAGSRGAPAGFVASCF